MALPEPNPQSSQTPARGRASAAETYFLTLATKDREPWLATPRTRDVFLAVVRSWHGERNGRILAVNVMPDHVHILVELSERLPVGQVVAGWKSATRRGAGYAETFKPEHQAHRLREGEDPEDYGLYMLLHPYRARVCAVGEAWPGWWAPEPAGFKFTTSLGGKSIPPQDWIDWPAERFAGLGLGD